MIIPEKWYNCSINYPRAVEAAGEMTKTWIGGFDMSIVTSPICGIYKITNNATGMAYVGQSRNIRARFAQHRQDRRQQDHNYYLHNAIAKYGLKNFSFEILEECTVDRLDDLEKYYIAHLDTIKPNGYNLNPGGNVNKEVTAETRAKMKAAWEGRAPFSDDWKKNISLGHEKPVSQFSRDGIFITTYKSTDEAASTVGTFAANITECLKGRNRIAKGFQWRYANNKNENIGAWNSKAKKSVCQFAIDGSLIATYESLTEAGKAVGCSKTLIYYCCRGITKTSAGFIWRYAECPLP